MTPVLTIRGLTKTYRSGYVGRASITPVLRSVDLDVGVGEIVGLLGPNGAGKSTLLLCAAGLLRPDQGTIAWFDQPLARDATPLGVGYVPERSAYYPFLSVRETVDYYSRCGGVAPRDRAARVDAVLDQLSLSAHASKRIKHLSRGMTQRLGLAQALVDSPRALLLDETLSGLDPLANREIRTLLGTLSARGVAIVISSHDMASLEQIATRIVIMTDGEVRTDFAATELTARGLLEQRFFDVVDRLPSHKVAEVRQ